MHASDRSRPLLFAGFLLFLLGLLTGLAIPALGNPRLGLAAHLTGLMNGTFLVVLGLSWERLRLAPRGAAAVFGLVLYATYANWAFGVVGAALGTGSLTPLAAGGRVAAPWKEALVGAGLVSQVIAILAGLVLVLWGLRRPAQATAGITSA